MFVGFAFLADSSIEVGVSASSALEEGFWVSDSEIKRAGLDLGLEEFGENRDADGFIAVDGAEDGDFWPGIWAF